MYVFHLDHSVLACTWLSVLKDLKVEIDSPDVNPSQSIRIITFVLSCHVRRETETWFHESCFKCRPHTFTEMSEAIKVIKLSVITPGAPEILARTPGSPWTPDWKPKWTYNELPHRPLMTPCSKGPFLTGLLRGSDIFSASTRSEVCNWGISDRERERARKKKSKKERERELPDVMWVKDWSEICFLPKTKKLTEFQFLSHQRHYLSIRYFIL